MADYKFSVIIPIYNSQLWISETIKSIIKQDIGFDENIELILVDDASTDDSAKICEEYVLKYPENIKFIQKEKNEGPGATRNVGLKYATGQYVNFLDSDDYISENTLSKILKFFNENPEVDVVSIPIYFFENKQGPHPLNYKYKKSKVVNLLDNPDYFQLSSPASYIKRSSIENICFPNIITSEDVVFINEILLNNPKLGLCSEGKYFYRKRTKKTSVIDNSYLNKDYYTKRVEEYFQKLIDKSLKKYSEVPDFIKNIFLYDLKWMLNDNIETILSHDEIELLKKKLKELLAIINDSLIYNQRLMNEFEKAKIFYLKYGKLTPEITSKLNLNELKIDIYEIIDDNLVIIANKPKLVDEEFDLYINDKKVEKKSSRFPQRDLYVLGERYCEDSTYEFNINLSKDEIYKLEFKLNGKLLNINFERPCNLSKVIGYAKSKNYLSIWNNTEIIIKKKTTLSWLKLESKTLLKLFKEKPQGYKTAIPIRIGYLLGYPLFRNKRICFYMDRMESADDNAMYLFKYAQGKDKNVKKYFILNKDSPDYEKMKKIGNVISFKSIKHRYYGLYAENIITSHPDNQYVYPFWGNYPNFAGLLKSNISFLQHGIIKDDISSWLNRFSMNLSFFLTSSTKEYESIFENPYNYPENIIKLLGLPRFDSLTNKETKKQILIMPTWRHYLEFKPLQYIKNNEHFKRFNSLINNEKLIEIAKKYDYEIIFKPHPKMIEYLELFDINDNIKIANDTDYQTLFNNGSLLITDYSSVTFDFAYLYKPVIYYQYADDYHFNAKEGYFQYKDMGFGEVIDNENELINTIEEYLKNDCKIKDKYSKRIKDFFLYHDKNNCQRVYDEIRKIKPKY